MSKGSNYLPPLQAWLLPTAALATIAAIVWLQPRFLSGENLINVLRQTSFLAIFALAQMVPILTRGLDLSQGGVVTITSVCFAIAANIVGTELGAVFGLIVGLSAGFLSGFLTAIVGISPFVATLGVGFALQGLALILSNGQPVFDVPSNFGYIGYGILFGIPIPVLVAITVFVFAQVVLRMTVPGRFIYAVGSNSQAATLSGIPVKIVIVLTYVLSGFLTGLGSLLLSSRISSGHPTAGTDTALQAIAAVVIGGVSLFGGRGSPIGVLLGALYLGILGNALNLLNISSYVQQVVVGTAIILAVTLDRFRAIDKRI